MAKKNMFYGATISYDEHIKPYRTQGIFSHFVIQPVILDGDKADDDFALALWAINNIGAVMNGNAPIQLTQNTYSIKAKKKIHFANGYLEKSQLDKLYAHSTFNLGLAPKEYPAEIDYIMYDIFNADLLQANYTALDVINPSPPARRMP